MSEVFMSSSVSFVLESTKSGLPAMWESGGGASNTGNATVVARGDGHPLTPLFIKSGGHLAGGDHALFVVKEGNVIVKVSRHREDIDLKVYKIINIKDENGKKVAETRIIGFESEGESDIPEQYKAAVETAKKKSFVYHCRNAMFYKEKA